MREAQITDELRPLRITIFSESSHGGIADYAHDQANSLAARGIDVEMLCPRIFIEGRNIAYKPYPILKVKRPFAGLPAGFGYVRKAALAAAILQNARILHSHVATRRPDAVLMHFSEYLAPMWAWRLRQLRREGVGFHSVLHDPVRSYRVGPQWWHDLSVKEAYSVLDSVFVHTRESVPVPRTVKVTWVPYGVHSFPPAVKSRQTVREELGLPNDARVLVAFGYIRDNKNLDLVLGAIADMQGIYLIVAGTEQRGGNKPIAYYSKLADTLGCGDRCRWITRFTSAQEVADLMCASDLSILTYSRSFVSSSAALGVAAHYRVPSLISSGSQTTAALVRQYRIGIWVEPDDAEAIKLGLIKWIEEGIDPDWQSYSREHSWARNAEIVHETIMAFKTEAASIARSHE